MALDYKLEFVFDDTSPSDASVFIHLRENAPVYQAKIAKEDYDILDEDLKDDFLTGLFTIAGVVELSTKAYRIWLMKSPVYNWDEVLQPVLYYLKDFYGESSLNALPGSGMTLSSPSNRRKA